MPYHAQKAVIQEHDFNFDAGLHNGTASLYGITSTDMYGAGAPAANAGADFALVNAFGGKLFISASTNQGVANTGFTITYAGLGKEACVTMATADWGTGGLAGIEVRGAGDAAAKVANITEVDNTNTFILGNLPIALDKAYTACASPEGKNYITWYFY